MGTKIPLKRGAKLEGEQKGEKEKICIGREPLGNGGGSTRSWVGPKGVWGRDN